MVGLRAWPKYQLGWLAVSGTRDDVTIQMKSQPQPTTQEVLAGPVERVTFHNDDSGFCVLRIKARGHRELVTVIGHAAVISAGEWITASGEWINDRTHGQQFKAKFLKTSEPTSLDGIEKYLGSGMIRGIGPVYAKKLVRAFGEKVFDTIEAEPERLREVTGIGAVRASRITTAWADQKIIREIMVFLHSNGVGTARAVLMRRLSSSMERRCIGRLAVVCCRPPLPPQSRFRVLSAQGIPIPLRGLKVSSFDSDGTRLFDGTRRLLRDIGARFLRRRSYW